MKVCHKLLLKIATFGIISAFSTTLLASGILQLNFNNIPSAYQNSTLNLAPQVSQSDCNNLTPPSSGTTSTLTLNTSSNNPNSMSFDVDSETLKGWIGTGQKCLLLRVMCPNNRNAMSPGVITLIPSSDSNGYTSASPNILNYDVSQCHII